MQGFLKYGECIVLYANYNFVQDFEPFEDIGNGSDPRNQPITESKVSKKSLFNLTKLTGFLSTKGFMNKNIAFQTIEGAVDHTTLTVDNIVNFRDFVFMVTPKLKSDFHRDYLVALYEFDKLKKAFESLGDDDEDERVKDLKASLKPQLDNFEKKVKKAKKRAQKEKEMNSELIETSKGEFVTYGSEIQLMHKDSKGFVCAMSECSKTEQIGYRVGIETDFRTNMEFTFIPKYKTRKRGDLIQYTDKIKLRNIENGHELSISPSNFYGPENHFMVDDNPYITQKILCDPKCEFHKVYLGESEFSDWQIFLHTPAEDKKTKRTQKVIRGGHLVRITHSEINALLASSLSFSQKTPELYFRNYNGEHKCENYSCNTIWEICHDRQVFQGQPFKVCKQDIILRHFNSGRILAVNKTNGSLYLENFDQEHRPEHEETKLFVIPLQLGALDLRTANSYKITLFGKDHRNLYLSQSESYFFKDSLEDRGNMIQMKKEMQFTPLENHFFDETRLRANFTKHNKVEEAYKISFIDRDEMNDMLYLRSCLPDFVKISKIFKSRKKADIDNQLLVDTEYLLKNIICFLYEVEYDPEADYTEEIFENLEPKNYKQRILKDLNYLEILIDIVHYPFHNKLYDIQEVHTLLYIPDVVTLSYCCIRNGIKEYRPNELYASQWLDLMIMYSLSKLDNKIQANETLTELIDNNSRILETRIKRETIEKFVYNLKENGGNAKLVEILRAICICDEKPMLKNQKIITDVLIKDNDVREALIQPITLEKGSIVIMNPYPNSPAADSKTRRPPDVNYQNEEWINLSSLKAASGERYYEFYTSFIKLLADLCQERNMTAIHILRSYFSVEICIKAIQSELYDQEIRSSFCRLMESLWIDFNPFMQLKIPSNIKSWKKVKSASIFNVSENITEDIQQYQELTEFVTDYMSDMDNFKDWKNSSSFTLQIINLCNKMLNVGFFNNVADVGTIFQNLCRILHQTDLIVSSEAQLNADDVNQFVLDRSKAKIDDNILRIKKKSHQLMLILIEIQVDLKLNDIIYGFKKRGGSSQGSDKGSSTQDEPKIDVVRKSRANKTDEGVVPSSGPQLKNPSGNSGTASNSGGGHQPSLFSKIKAALPAPRHKSDDAEAYKQRNSYKKPLNEFKTIFEEICLTEENSFIKKEKDFIELILTQTLYKYPELKALSLQLLSKIFRNSVSLSRRLKEIQIIEDNESNKLYESIDEISQYLFRLGETMEVWYSVSSDEKIAYMELLLRSLEKKLHLTHVDEKDQIIEGANQKKIRSILENNRFMQAHLNKSFKDLITFVQDLSRNTSCIEYLLEIMKNSMNMEQRHTQTPKKIELTYLINLILAECCHNNKRNKRYLLRHLDSLFMKNLKNDSLGYNVCVLLKHLIHNNKEILLDPERSSAFIHQMMSNMNSISNRNYYRRAYHLYTLQSCIFYKHQSLRANQNVIISLVISTKQQHIFRRMNSDRFKDTLIEDMRAEFRTFKYSAKTVELLPPELCFDIAVIDLIANCSFDKNAFAENIAQSLISLKTIAAVLDFAQERHALLVYELLKLNYHVYVETEKPYSNQSLDKMMQVMEIVYRIMCQRMEDIIARKAIRLYLTHKELINSDLTNTDLVSSAMDNLKIFFQQILGNDSTKVDVTRFSNLFYKTISSLESYYKELKSQRLRHKSALMLKFMNSCVKKRNRNLAKQEDKIERIMTKNIQSIQEEIDSDDLFQKMNTMTNARQRQLFTIFRQNVLMNQSDLKEKMKKRSTAFEICSKHYVKSEKYREFSGKEFRELIEWKYEVDSNVFGNFLRELVLYLDPSNNDDKRTIELGLKIFNDFVSLTPEEDEDDDKQRSRALRIKQNRLVNLGVVELICRLICSSKDEKNLMSAIEVANRILEDGNIKAQDEFYRVFKQVPKAKDVVSKLIQVLKKNFECISETMLIENNQRMKSLVIGQKNDDIFNKGLSEFDIMSERCEKILKFFQLLCEGHHENLQNYLREGNQDQENTVVKATESNAVAFTASLFGNYIKFFNFKCCNLGEQLIDLLIELVQGPCQGNQAQMMDSKVVNYCKDFINDLNGSSESLNLKGFVLVSANRKLTEEHIDVLNRLFSNTISLLLSILESNMDQRVINRIGESVQFQFLISKLTNIFYGYMEMNKLTIDQLETRKEYTSCLDLTFHEDLEEAFEIYFFIQIINDNTGLYKAPINQMEAKQIKAYTFFKENSASIEVVFQDTLQRIYFMKHPVTNYLSKELKNEVMSDVRRDNPNEKISDFFAAAPKIFDSMEHRFTLAKNYKLKKKYLDISRDIALFISVLINLYILFYFEIEVRESKGYNNETYPSFWGFKALGLLHIAISAVMIILQTLILSKMILINKWRKFLAGFRVLMRNYVKPDHMEDQILLGLAENRAIRLPISDLLKIYRRSREIQSGVEGSSSGVPIFTFMTQNLIFILSDFGFVYFIFYFTCSMLSFVGDIPILYCVSLFEIIHRFDTLKNVIRSITYNGDQLLLTALLGVVFVWIYALFGYYFLIDSFWNDIFGANGENQCTSVIHCFMTVFSLGPRSSGGIGDLLVQESYMRENRVKYYARLIYDVTCFYIVNITLLNIIFGIIIDSFAVLRDLKTNKEEDTKNFCFVCSIKRESFDKTAKGFEAHIKNDHYVWNYLFYIYYLEQKKRTDYNGVETYVSRMLKQDDHSWIPIGKALVLQDVVDQDVDIEKLQVDTYQLIENLIKRSKKLKL